MIVQNHDVVSLLRDLEPRRNARRQYLADAERLEAMSRALFRQERHYEAEGAHYWSMVLLRAAEAERNGPDFMKLQS